METKIQAVAVQDVAVTEDKGVMGLTMRFLPATGAVGALVFTSAANAAEFSLDMASLLINIGVVIAAVTAVGLASLSLALTVKSFKYVKSAF
jgi:alpha-glucuronidase